PVAVHHAPPPQAPVPVRAGSWKIQLGAFRDEGNARALWNSVAGRLPGARPIYASAHGVTRVQAGPFASKAEAQRACAASRVNCNVVAP
ncbi:SPOR domain-containing protein, partial [Sphingomonas bacterium]|uniref:SPOR domain-containing protein n=1 Tax=Sphingomonas bacterium TaxID=1895847 RepID=UPI001575E062